MADVLDELDLILSPLDEGETSKTLKQQLLPVDAFKKLSPEDWEALGARVKEAKVTASIFTGSLATVLRYLRRGGGLPASSAFIEKFVKDKNIRPTRWAKSKGIMSAFAMMAKDGLLKVSKKEMSKLKKRKHCPLMLPDEEEQEELEYFRMTSKGWRLFNDIGGLGVDLKAKNWRKIGEALEGDAIEIAKTEQGFKITVDVSGEKDETDGDLGMEDVEETLNWLGLDDGTIKEALAELAGIDAGESVTIELDPVEDPS